MNGNPAVMSPRRLLVFFYDYGLHISYYRIQRDKGDCPQLVHVQQIDPLPPPSRLDRLLMRLGYQPRPSWESREVTRQNDQAIAAAHEFVTSNYRPGDQVILLAEQYYRGDYAIKEMKILAGHLHNGTTPGEHFTVRPGGENAPRMRIPIYAVAVIWWNHSTESISLTNDGLKSRLPPGIEHIICYEESDSKGWSCSSVCDLDGDIRSRVISIYAHASRYSNRIMHITRHLIYYEPLWIRDWDMQKPVWNKVLGSSPSGIPRNYLLSMLPAGMYRHELSRYQGGQEESDRLVWKSFRD